MATNNPEIPVLPDEKDPQSFRSDERVIVDANMQTRVASEDDQVVGFINDLIGRVTQNDVDSPSIPRPILRSLMMEVWTRGFAAGQKPQRDKMQEMISKDERIQSLEKLPVSRVIEAHREAHVDISKHKVDAIMAADKEGKKTDDQKAADRAWVEEEKRRDAELLAQKKARGDLPVDKQRVNPNDHDDKTTVADAAKKELEAVEKRKAEERKRSEPPPNKSDQNRKKN